MTKKYTFTPANICDIAEAMKRMIDGEVFTHKHSRFMKFEDRGHDGLYPFRTGYLDGEGSTDDIKGLWNYVSTWEIRTETEWFDDITDENHILCFVSDDEAFLGNRAEYIINYRKGNRYPFEVANTVYRYARPVTADDLQIKPDTSGC